MHSVAGKGYSTIILKPGKKPLYRLEKSQLIASLIETCERKLNNSRKNWIAKKKHWQKQQRYWCCKKSSTRSGRKRGDVASLRTLTTGKLD